MQLAFGCSRLGGASSKGGWRAAVRLVQEAVDAGVTVFDTADVYGCGMSERVLGRALRTRRAEVVIATKGGYVFRPRSRSEQTARRTVQTARRAVLARGTNQRSASGSGVYQEQDFSADRLRRQLEASLRRLQTDHVDVYQLHGPHMVVPGLFEELADLIASGKVLRFGVGAESVEEAAAWAPVPGLGVLQLPFGVLDQEAIADVFPVARMRSIEVWARGVLGGGLLTAAERDPGSLAAEPKRQLIDGVRALSAETGIDPYNLAIGFVRARRDVSIALIGVSSKEHVRRNMELMEQPPLPDEVLGRLRALCRDEGAPISGGSS